MKRIFGSIVIAFTFASCGDDTDALQKEICNCYQEIEEYRKSSLEAGSYSSEEHKKRFKKCYELSSNYIIKHRNETKIISDCL